jgi:N-acetylglutamate synthase-like GNAT family acetyltransferase
LVIVVIPVQARDGMTALDSASAILHLIRLIFSKKIVSMPPALSILPWSPARAQAFHDINAQWIEAMFALEVTDRQVLQNPQSMIIDKGGDILFVSMEGLGVVGACALMPGKDAGAFELTKMGVLNSARGLKAGEYLLAAVLDRARQMGIETLFLLTNWKCAAAIHLYEKLGFVHDEGIMATYGASYERCDVAMRFMG